MGSPQNIAGSASQLFFQDKTTLEYRAMTIISTLPHPQRKLLSTFVTESFDREKAAEIFLRATSTGEFYIKVYLEHGADLLSWATLISKARPIAAEDIDDSLERILRRRDGDRCCILRTKDNDKKAGRLVSVFLVPPNLIIESGMKEQTRLSRILEAYVGDSHWSHLRQIMNQDILRSDLYKTSQLMTLSTIALGHMANGRVSLDYLRSSKVEDSDLYLLHTNSLVSKIDLMKPCRQISLNNRAAEDAILPDQHLLEIHQRFAEPLAWLEVTDHMARLTLPGSLRSSVYSKNIRRSLQAFIKGALGPISRFALAVWLHSPVLIKAYAYRGLASIGCRFYGGTLSSRVLRLPFNLYLRISPKQWEPKLRAEFRALQLVKAYTQVPAPTPVDVIQYSGHSYFLMTAVPGKPIGPRLATMTDAQMHEAARDLQQYVAEVRSIPNNTDSGWAICNSLGAGILDWRIGDSQRDELMFANEKEFTEYLTGKVNETTRQRATELSPNTSHDIVFTHGDLNPRNILCDENGKITGIVDWECAGWFPEYWEYSKAHFTVRYTISWLADVIDRVFPGYREELWAENMLSDARPLW